MAEHFVANLLSEGDEAWPGMHVPGSVRLPPTYVEGWHDRAAVERMKYSPLGGTGMVVSILGLGGSALGGCYGEVEEVAAVRSVHLALKSGVNYIDTAVWYGQGKSEELLGKALAGVPRQAYYIATKACRYETAVLEMFDFSAARTLRSVDESLARLGLAYVDVIQVHDPEFCDSVDQVATETMPALDEARRAGKARFVGVTGYPLGVQREILARTPVQVDTSLAYCHYALNDRTLLTDLLPLLEERGMGVVNASALGMGLLSEAGPPAWHPATEEVKAACRAAVDHCKAQGVNVSKLALHFSLHSCDRIPTCLVSTNVYEYMVMNIEAASATLTEAEEAAIAHMRDDIFAGLSSPTWEGEEVAKYRKKREKALQQAAQQAEAGASQG